MFVGEHRHSLDAKGRVIFPARMRDELGQRVVLQKGIERCVEVLPWAEWERRVEQVTRLRRTDPDARRYARFFFSQASEERVDGQGRLTVPQPYREYAGLDREVVIVGSGSFVELWDRDTWERHRGEVEGDLPSFAARIGI